MSTAKLMDENFKLTEVFYKREAIKLFPEEETTCEKIEKGDYYEKTGYG